MENKYSVGQRVQYTIQGHYGGPVHGEGITTAEPFGMTSAYGQRYRVRHDGGTSTYYTEVGVLEAEITAIVG